MKEIVLDEETLPAELADLLDVASASVIRAAFEELGLLLTVAEVLSFEQASVIAKRFGFRARRQGS